MNDVLPSAFNPDTFLDSSVEAPFETVRTTVPAKDGYIGSIDDIKMRVLDTKGGPRVVIDIFWKIHDDLLAQQLNMPNGPIVRQNIFVDLDENGKLAKGVNQNVLLGQVRDACNQNQPGAWAPRMLIGAGPCRLKVSERVDERNVAIKYNDVDRVARMS